MAGIHARGLRKSFGTHTVLDGVDLDVEPGRIVALLGSNGAGKTTTIDIVTTLTRPDAGSVMVDGHDVATDPRAVRRAIAVTGQSATVDGLLTAAENLELIGRLRRLRRRAARERAMELIESVGLRDAAHRRVATFSGGMRRRLDLALSMVSPAPAVFLDEPTTGLDTRARATLWEQVRELATAGAAVLMTTQYLEEADQLADEVLILHGGRVIERDTPAQLKERIGVSELLVRDSTGAVVDREPTDGTADGLRRALAAVQSRRHLDAEARIDVRRPTLDDAFLALTSEETR